MSAGLKEIEEIRDIMRSNVEKICQCEENEDIETVKGTNQSRDKVRVRSIQFITDPKKIGFLSKYT
jgi:hypothetical protein